MLTVETRFYLISRESKVDLSSMIEKIGFAFFFAASILGMTDKAVPTPMNEKKGIKDPLNTVSRSTLKVLTVMK